MAYYMHRVWRRQFYDSAGEDLYSTTRRRIGGTWGTLVGWYGDGYKFLSLQERNGKCMARLEEEYCVLPQEAVALVSPKSKDSEGEFFPRGWVLRTNAKPGSIVDLLALESFSL